MQHGRKPKGLLRQFVVVALSQCGQVVADIAGTVETVGIVAFAVGSLLEQPELELHRHAREDTLFLLGEHAGTCKGCMGMACHIIRNCIHDLVRCGMTSRGIADSGYCSFFDCRSFSLAEAKRDG